MELKKNTHTIHPSNTPIKNIPTPIKKTNHQNKVKPLAITETKFVLDYYHKKSLILQHIYDHQEGKCRALELAYGFKFKN